MSKVLSAGGLALLAVGMASGALDADLRVISRLCAATNHEAAIKEYVALGESCTDPQDRYDAISKAAACARLHLRSETRALELCDKIGVEPYIKGCRAYVYTWMILPSNVVAEFRNENFDDWPEALAAVGLAARSSAYYRMGMGEEAARDYLRTFQRSKSYAKWGALQKLGDTYWKLLDDELIAEACYRKCMSSFGGGWPGLQARVNLGNLLLSQERYDAALQCLQECPVTAGSWKASHSLVEARVFEAMGRKDEAVRVLEELRAMVGIRPDQKNAAEKMLERLQNEPTL